MLLWYGCPMAHTGFTAHHPVVNPPKTAAQVIVTIPGFWSCMTPILIDRFRRRRYSLRSVDIPPKGKDGNQVIYAVWPRGNTAL